jgi:hypothetical protein
VLVRYGPFPSHVAILIPKQHPCRPYHSLSLARKYIDLDRTARLIIELSLKIVAATPPPPSDGTRKEYMIELRLVIVQEAVRLGFWKDLLDAT